MAYILNYKHRSLFKELPEVFIPFEQEVFYLLYSIIILIIIEIVQYFNRKQEN